MVELGEMLFISKMRRINLIGSTFTHAYSSTWWKKPKLLSWDYGTKNNDVTVYVDNSIELSINDKNDGKIKYGWLLESKYISPVINNKIKSDPYRYLNGLEGIFTCDKDLLEIDKKFLWSPAYGVSVEKYGGKKKTKLMSVISSNKTITEQQKERVNFINQYKDKIDIYGNGFNPIKEKNEGLDDYMFSIAIENGTYDTYFTEKILDCFATKTIPIYKGSRNITKFFNEEGIIFLDDINWDITKIDDVEYNKRIEYVNVNYNKVKEFDVLDDWIYKKYIK